MKSSFPTRRWLGVLFLVIAATQVALGLTVLKEKLDALAALLYWTACLLATFAAIVCAMVDALRCLTESRQERRSLLESTLREIDEERARRDPGAGKSLSESH